MRFFRYLKTSDKGAGWKLSDFGIVVILGLSLVLLTYVGLGEAYRTYPRFELDRLGAQGEIIKDPFDTFLLAGLPIEQFPGFSVMGRNLLDSDKTIASIVVTDNADNAIFETTRAEIGGLETVTGAPFLPSALQTKNDRGQITESSQFYRISLELRNKLETVGHLNLFLPKSTISARVNATFSYVAGAGVAVLVGYALLVRFVLSRLSEQRENRWLTISYVMAFFLMAVIVVVSLVSIYSDGIRGKTKALADSLSQRLSAPITLNLTLDTFTELQDVFNDYRELYPELSYVAMTVDGITRIHTDPRRIDTAWVPYSDNYEYTVELAGQSAATSALRFGVHVGIPQSVILDKLWRSAKNFFVLFVATAFIAVLLLNLLRSLTEHLGLKEISTAQRHAHQLGLIKPFFFLAVFSEGLAASFLAQHLQGLALGSGVDGGVASGLFTAYFAAYGLSMLPAGRIVERGGTKQLLVVGVLLTFASLIAMAFVTCIYPMFLIRIVAGAAQGLILVAVQDYILESVPAGQQTRGAAILVFNYNCAVISSTAMGALLSVYMGRQGVFIMAASLSLLVLLFAITLVPKLLVELAPIPGAIASALPRLIKPSFWYSLSLAVRDAGFVKTILLVGMPSKASVTGVTAFALPLLLARQTFAQEDIGQIMMFYPAGLLVSSMYISKLVDRSGKSGASLFVGTVGAGLGLVMIGFMDSASFLGGPGSPLATASLVFGMIILGVSHGFIIAPIITHVANSSAAATLGRPSATSLYRFLERLGHMSGPIFVSQLLFFNQDSASTIAWIGIATIALGLLFQLNSGGRVLLRPIAAVTH